MKRLKKLFEIIIIISIVMVAVAGTYYNTVYASDSITSGLYTYIILDDDTIAINGYSGTEANVVVPATIDGKQVTAIYPKAFLNNSSIKTISLPDGLKIIESRSFKNCQNLTTVYVPESVIYINYSSNEDCPKLVYQMSEDMVEIDDGYYIKPVNMTVTGTYNYDLASDVVDLVNERRKEADLEELEYSVELTETAMQRAAETSIYWSHLRPTSTILVASGENIGWSRRTSASGIMASWMNSSGHKAAILNERFKSIGVGCYISNGITYWVQLFSSKSSTNTEVITGSQQDITNKIAVVQGKGYIDLSVSGISSETTLTIGDTISPTSVKNKNKGNSFYTVIEFTDVTWTSSDTSVFTVSEEGVVTAVGVGTATLTAKLGDSTQTFTIIVEEKDVVELRVTNSLIQLEKIGSESSSQNIDATYVVNEEVDTSTKITYKSNNTKVAAVDSNGVVTAVGEGTTTITVTAGDLTEEITVIVTVIIPETGVTLSDSEITLDVGDSSTLSATITPSNATDTTVTWSSSDESVVTVDSNGVVTAVNKGTAVITVKTANGFTDTCNIIVKQPVTKITLNKTVLTLKKGNTSTLSATITPTNATDTTVTWSSSDTKIASVSEDGTVTAKSNGTVTITATTSNGLTATCTIIVGDYLLGDMNANGEIDLADILVFLKVYFGRLATTEYYQQVGDMNGNGEIDLKDLVLLMKTYFNC